ncbi:MAG TPA: hypothetical protein ENH82_08950 [bacterium]|nr:hypothetical protein [bacterium]
MFIGHYAVALAAKRAVPKLSLGTLFLSTQLIDLFWPIFLLLGLEHVRIDPGNTVVTDFDFYDYPITHSLLGVILWSLALGVIYFLVRRYSRGAYVVGAVVFSHWILDLITHRPDLPLIPGMDIYAGLGLWNSFAGTLLVEGGLFITAVILYARSIKALDSVGFYAFWGLIIFLLLAYISNLFSAPPPDETSVALATLMLWLFIPWGYWIDRHRKIVDS